MADTTEATDTRAVIDQLVLDINKGRGDWSYHIIETRTVRCVDEDTVAARTEYVVVRRQRGTDEVIGKVGIRDGNLAYAMINQDVAFHKVPRFLRGIA